MEKKMKNFLMLVGILFLMLNVDVLYSENEKPVNLHVHREGGGGCIWNLWGNYYEQVIYDYEGTSNTHTLTCLGNGRETCRVPAVTVPPTNPSNLYFNDLSAVTETMENYAGNQIQNNVLTGNYSNIFNYQGIDYLRTVTWSGTDINNNNIVIVIGLYSPY